MSGNQKRDDRTNVEKAIAAWGNGCPDWVLVMAETADAGSQGKVGARLGYKSGSVISSVIAKTYPGDMGMVEERVRGELMSATVMCPATGEISLAVCLDNQSHAQKGNRTSAFRARMVKACKECPNSRFGG
ncbi:hypothetical protein [Magnetovibrio sp.]|uniref:hypothetical protein n=1 Tax=Magnetovibrio sp. TaxID=2024836 RepID=UPI002F9353DA